MKSGGHPASRIDQKLRMAFCGSVGGRIKGEPRLFVFCRWMTKASYQSQSACPLTLFLRSGLRSLNGNTFFVYSRRNRYQRPDSRAKNAPGASNTDFSKMLPVRETARYRFHKWQGNQTEEQRTETPSMNGFERLFKIFTEQIENFENCFWE